MDAHHTAFTTPRVITASKTKAGDQDQTGRLRLKRAPAHTIMKAGARRKGASSLCSRLDDQAFDGSDLSSSEEYARGDALSSGHDDTDEDYDEGEATNEKRRKAIVMRSKRARARARARRARTESSPRTRTATT
jgi:hypothetical protein